MYSIWCTSIHMANTYGLRHARLLYPNSTSCSLIASTCRRIHSTSSFQRTPKVSQLQRSSVGPAKRTVLETGSKITLSVRTHEHQKTFSTNILSLKRVCSITKHIPVSSPCVSFACLHSWSMLMAPPEGGKDTTKPKSKTSEAHGSVLMEMIKSQDQQPKQLTVGAKGRGWCMSMLMVYCTCCVVHYTSC